MSLRGTLILGNIVITDCDPALVIAGEEVFRLRERAHGGQLVVDFDLRDPAGERIAKIAKNHVVYIAEGFDVASKPGRYQVIRKTESTMYAAVEEVSPRTIKVTGTFCVAGIAVVASDSGTTIGTNTVSRCQIVGFGTAVEVTVKGIGHGRRTAPVMTGEEETRWIRDELLRRHGVAGQRLNDILFDEDPALVNFEVNIDEYEPEVRTILPRLRDCRSSEEVEQVLREELQRWFGYDALVSTAKYQKIAQRVWDEVMPHLSE